MSCFAFSLRLVLQTGRLPWLAYSFPQSSDFQVSVIRTAIWTENPHQSKKPGNHYSHIVLKAPYTSTFYAKRWLFRLMLNAYILRPSGIPVQTPNHLTVHQIVSYHCRCHDCHWEAEPIINGKFICHFLDTIGERAMIWYLASSHRIFAIPIAARPIPRLEFENMENMRETTSSVGWSLLIWRNKPSRKGLLLLVPS